MTCKQCEQHLNAFADNALPRLQAGRVRHHLARCPACAAALAEIVQIGAEARAWRDAAPSAALQGRILAALPPQTDRKESAAMRVEHPVFSARPPRRFVTRKVRIALALTACLAVVLAVTLWPSKQAPLPSAYADTVLAMQRVRTAAWTNTNTVYKADGSIAAHQILKTWVRRDPPAIAYLMPPYPLDLGGGIGGGYRALLNAQGLHQTNLDDGKTITEPLQKPIAEEVRDKLSSLTANNAAKGTPMKIGGSATLIHQTPWTQERAALNGHILLRFGKDMTVMLTGIPDLAMKSPIVMHLYYTLWVEPETHRVQREEWQSTIPKFGRSDDVNDHFVYDQPAPAGVFDAAAYPAAGFRPAASLRKPR